MFDKLAVGDSVAWWADSHGRGVEAHDPKAVLRSGRVVSVHHHPTEPNRVVACLVECRAPAAGVYIATIRPDQGHQPTVLTRADDH
ncbi:hypothetical protein [Nocardia terpenica]|uniref:DUF2945 domain-containing protein n=1 Tax=Nocardia terpenica TaxID=455432 RepID=A0A164LBF5_9NOCA|nr:hypothetical protein [Nocardia terpenica]KZM72221.1 hypothetical protein AWN90_36710 [Nocardia terpenica]NQE86635.1 hypothetical protein [Nocardia terpenica]